MHESVEEFLEQVARRGSWIGGGSVAALSAALSAALLEKLVVDPTMARRLRRLWHECLALIDRDAHTFARVIHATRANNRHAFARSLKAATEVPCRVFECARTVTVVAQAARKTIKPKFQSDLRCAIALAHASSAAAQALIQTNLAWLNDPGYRRKVRRRLATAGRTDGR